MTDSAIVSSRQVFNGRVFDVRVDEVRVDGEVHRVDVVEHGASMAIVAVPEAGRIVLVRQRRHAVETPLWEVPAGTAEPGEDPDAGALRELSEETGYRAESLTHIGSFYTSPGFCDEIVHLYHAHHLTLGAQALDDDERIDVATPTLEEAWRLVGSGGVADCKTVLALLWLRNGRLAF